MRRIIKDYSESPLYSLMSGGVAFLGISSCAFFYLAQLYPSTLMSMDLKLYHYTDLAGLYGIISNKGFWLSDARFLNDREEIVNGRNLCSQIIDQFLAMKKYRKYGNVLERTKSELVSSSDDVYHVASFSRDPDSLEQWRAYARNGKGACIGLDLGIKTRYQHFNMLPTLQFRSVIYSDKIKENILSIVIRSGFRMYVKDSVSRNVNEKDYVDDHVKHLKGTFQYFFHIFKHPAFSTENEVRLIMSEHRKDDFEGKHFRVSGGMIVPYYCTNEQVIFDSDHNRKEPDNLPISSVAVGPTSDQNLLVESIGIFLAAHGYNENIVKKSSVPYRV